ASRGVHARAPGQAAEAGEGAATEEWDRAADRRVREPPRTAAVADRGEDRDGVRGAGAPEIRDPDFPEWRGHRGGDRSRRHGGARGPRRLHGMVQGVREPDHRGPRKRVLYALRPHRRDRGERGRRCATGAADRNRRRYRLPRGAAALLRGALSRPTTRPGTVAPAGRL